MTAFLVCLSFFVVLYKFWCSGSWDGEVRVQRGGVESGDLSDGGDEDEQLVGGENGERLVRPHLSAPSAGGSPRRLLLGPLLHRLVLLPLLRRGESGSVLALHALLALSNLLRDFSVPCCSTGMFSSSPILKRMFSFRD